MPFLQIFLGSPSGSILILKTQYLTLFLPALFLAFIFGIKKIVWLKFFSDKKSLVIAATICAAIYGSIIFGPFASSVYAFTKTGLVAIGTEFKNNLIKKIPAGAAVAASYDFITKLSSRPNIYALNYFFLGKTQFGATEYFLPENTEYLAINFSDFLTYKTSAGDNPLYRESYLSGGRRIRERIEKDGFGVVEILEDLALLKKGAETDIKLFQIYDGERPDIENTQRASFGDINFLGFEIKPASENKLLIKLFWETARATTTDWQIEIGINDSSGHEVHNKIYPLAYGLYPTFEWRPGEIVQTNFWLEDNKNFSKIEIQLLEIKKGGFFINETRGVTYRVYELDRYSEKIGLEIRD